MAPISPLEICPEFKVLSAEETQFQLHCRSGVYITGMIYIIADAKICLINTSRLIINLRS